MRESDREGKGTPAMKVSNTANTQERRIWAQTQKARDLIVRERKHNVKRENAS